MSSNFWYRKDGSYLFKNLGIYTFFTDSATASATHWLKADGIICSLSGFSTKFAKALAAAILWSSVIWGILASNAQRKIPGNAKTLFTWFGKSLLQVATIKAPASLA